MEMVEELRDAGITGVGKISGVITGRVKENWSEDYPGMVKVEYFLGEAGLNQTGWIPVAVPYAGNAYGCYALPEIGSEVVVAFQMGDRNCPIVLGCIWNQQNVLPADTANENNTVKKWMTKGGCEICLSEEEGKEQILIRTPGGLALFLEDENGTIQVGDKEGKNGISIDTSKGTMILQAEKSLELGIGGNAMLSLDGNTKTVKVEAGKITCNADQSVELKGQNLKLEGTSTQVKGSGTLKLEADGTAQLKGAMVQLN